MRVPAVTFAAGRAGKPVLAWRSRASSIEGIQQELARIWTHPTLERAIDGDHAGVVDVGGARTSVMNLVVVARRPETGERCAAIIHDLTGRHPSRTLIVDAGRSRRPVLARREHPGPLHAAERDRAGDLRRDDLPDLRRRVGPPPRGDRRAAARSTTCRSRSGGPTSPRSDAHATSNVLEICDRLVVDGSSWHGSGLPQLRQAGAFQERRPIAISDFALIRQSRWREAIASIFDHPGPPAVSSGTSAGSASPTRVHDDGGVEATNIVKPVYHVAWLASRLGHGIESRSLR